MLCTTRRAQFSQKLYVNHDDLYARYYWNRGWYFHVTKESNANFIKYTGTTSSWNKWWCIFWPNSYDDFFQLVQFSSFLFPNICRARELASIIAGFLNWPVYCVKLTLKTSLFDVRKRKTPPPSSCVRVRQNFLPFPDLQKTTPNFKTPLLAAFVCVCRSCVCRLLVKSNCSATVKHSDSKLPVVTHKY